MKGWFDAFRQDGGPTLYSYSNRTSVSADLSLVTLYIVFFTVFLAFLVIFPGVRKQKFTTFTSVTLSLFVGAVILVTKFGSGWHIGCTEIVSSYRAFSKEKIVADLGAYIGLNHVNVTLRALPRGNYTEDIDFNERFSWEGSAQMYDSYKEALVRGLPFPILTVAEYFSLGIEGFSWGGQYRAAGYYGNILLWAAFAMWLLMNLLLVVVPRYGAYAMALTGGLLLSTDLVYYTLIPTHPMVVRFEDRALTFRLGWCFYLVLIAGSLCLAVGLVISVIDLVYPHTFSTILEVDFDTPYDRHIIIEESHCNRAKTKKAPPTNRLEEPAGAGLGSRLLRRISSKKLETLAERTGLSNDGFEMDPPKSPWRYPFQRGPTGAPVGLRAGFGQPKGLAPHKSLAQHRIGLGTVPRPAGMGVFQRSCSQDSASSSCTASSTGSSLGISFLQQEAPLAVHTDPAVMSRRNQTSPAVVDSSQEVAMW